MPVEFDQRIAATLADLREALAGSKQAGLADQEAQKLKDRHPHSTQLIETLREKGFLPRWVRKQKGTIKAAKVK